MGRIPPMQGATPALVRRGKVLPWVVFACWGAGVCVMLGAMARESCGPIMTEPALAPETAAQVRGWRVRHVLPAMHPEAAAVAEYLARQEPPAGVAGEVWMSGGDGWLTARLRRAGWSVARGGETVEPRMEIFTPEGALAWSGGYRLGGESGTGGVLLASAVLAQAARGEAMPPFVPVGCVADLRGAAGGRR